MLLTFSIKLLNKVTQTLKDILQEWKAAGDVIPEVEWLSKIKTLEFQETLRARDALASKLSNYGCRLCENFEEHVSPRLYLQIIYSLSDQQPIVRNRQWGEGPP